MKATAIHHGGYRATVDVRGHTIAVDEPAEHGGEDEGVMPTELLAAALAVLLRARARPTPPAARASSCPG